MIYLKQFKNLPLRILQYHLALNLFLLEVVEETFCIFERYQKLHKSSPLFFWFFVFSYRTGTRVRYGTVLSLVVETARTRVGEGPYVRTKHQKK